MSYTYKLKWVGLLQSLLLLFVLLPFSVYGGQSVPKQTQFLSDWAFLVVGLALASGAWTARHIPTAVDNQIVGGSNIKLFIGLTSGTFATIGLSQRYPSLDMLDLIFPSYLLAAIGTPVMVYAISIASDAETYSAIGTWLKRRFGVGG